MSNNSPIKAHPMDWESVGDPTTSTYQQVAATLEDFTIQDPRLWSLTSGYFDSPISLLKYAEHFREEVLDRANDLRIHQDPTADLTSMHVKLALEYLSRRYNGPKTTFLPLCVHYDTPNDNQETSVFLNLNQPEWIVENANHSMVVPYLVDENEQDNDDDDSTYRSIDSDDLEEEDDFDLELLEEENVHAYKYMGGLSFPNNPNLDWLVDPGCTELALSFPIEWKNHEADTKCKSIFPNGPCTSLTEWAPSAGVTVADPDAIDDLLCRVVQGHLQALIKLAAFENSNDNTAITEWVDLEPSKDCTSPTAVDEDAFVFL